MVREFSFVTSLAVPALSRHGDAHRHQRGSCPVWQGFCLRFYPMTFLADL
jgi:hypothetical protein